MLSSLQPGRHRSVTPPHVHRFALVAKRGSSHRTTDLLLVEANPTDIDRTREALRVASLRSRLHVVRDGEAALQYVRRQGRYARAPRPDLILLNLDLPKKDGQEVLRDLKADPALRRIPVIVLTASVADEDVLRSYDLLANSYIAKPQDVEAFARIIQSLHDFWLTVVQLPPKYV